MPHQFHITVQPVGAHDATCPPLQFDVVNHDDLLVIAQKMRALNAVPEGEMDALSIGLKLFSEVLIQHRREPLFAPLWPHFSAFMQRLKALPVAGAED